MTYIPSVYFRDREYIDEVLRKLNETREKNWKTSAISLLRYAFLPDTFADWEELKFERRTNVSTDVYLKFQDMILEILPFVVQVFLSEKKDNTETQGSYSEQFLRVLQTETLCFNS